VVVAANFLIDAESNLKAALSGLGPRRPGQRSIGQPPGAPARWSHRPEGRHVTMTHGPVASLKLAGHDDGLHPGQPVAGGQAQGRRRGRIEFVERGTPLDALPDLSDVQVIVYTEYPGPGAAGGRGPGHLSADHRDAGGAASKVVRGFSFFGASFVYVIFEDGTDIYWARSRVLEYLNFAAGRLPQGVTPQLGPDATGVGWVYQYVVLAKDMSLAELRSLQDWYVRYQLTKAQGVAEVASIGGFVQQYQVTVDPASCAATASARRSRRRSAPPTATSAAAWSRWPRPSTWCAAAATCAACRHRADLVLKAERGTPVLMRDVARVELVPDERRGIAELNGEGEVASRHRHGALRPERARRDRQRQGQDRRDRPGLPAGVEIATVYDRSELIERAIATLKTTLIEESLIVALVCVIFLLHVRSALVAIIMLPVGVLIAFIAMRALGMGSNIMSLGGIAIAIGAMVDAAIVMIENAHKHIERLPEGGHPKPQRAEAIVLACKEVGPALFFRC
jgi:Cu(I)/Ag(I) efflux system membrane protein CusA/SilA